jgi:hypothetical protein
MCPQRLYTSIAYGPSELLMMRAAFDLVWARIAPGVGDKTTSTDTARTKLADAVFAVAKDDYTNAEDLARRVMEAMSLAPELRSRTSDLARLTANTPKEPRQMAERRAAAQVDLR